MEERILITNFDYALKYLVEHNGELMEVDQHDDINTETETLRSSTSPEVFDPLNSLDDVSYYSNT